MTRSLGRRTGVVGAIAALAAVAATGATFAAPAAAAAAGPNPCKVLKRAEIQQVFGGIVGRGKKGVSTPASAQCEFSLSAAGDRPPGRVIVHVLTDGAKTTFKKQKKAARYMSIDGVDDGLYGEKGHVVKVLAGDVLVGVQGGFLVTTPLPLRFYDDQAQLTALAQTAAARV